MRSNIQPRMGTTITRLATGLALFLLAGCMSALYTHPLRVPDPSEPSAEVIIFREKAVMGSAWAITVYLQDEKLAKLRKGTYARLAIKPGVYDLRVGKDSIGSGPLTVPNPTRLMTFETGGKYFILLRGRMKELTFGPDQSFLPTSINEDQARILMKEYALIQ